MRRFSISACQTSLATRVCPFDAQMHMLSEVHENFIKAGSWNTYYHQLAHISLHPQTAERGNTGRDKLPTLKREKPSRETQYHGLDTCK